MIRDQGLAQLRLDGDLRLDALASMPCHGPQFGLQRRRRLKRSPSPTVGSHQVRQHERVEAVVLANRGLVPLAGSCGDPRTHRKDNKAFALEPFNEQSLASLDRDSDETVVIM